MFKQGETVVTGSIPAFSNLRSQPVPGRRAPFFASAALAYPLLIGAVPVQTPFTGVVEHGNEVGSMGAAATVYRDVHGVPHIEATDEAAAWYALGYEEARDGLWEIQKVVKAVRGEASKYLGDSGGASFLGLPGNIFADLANKLFDAYLGDPMAYPPNGMSDNDLMELFKDEDAPHPSEEYQLFHNLKAYAKGIEDFRDHLQNDTLTIQEEIDMKAWLLASPDRSWALVEAVNHHDVMSWGRHNKAAAQLGMAALAEVNPNGMPTLPAPPMPMVVRPDRLSIQGNPTDPMENLKQLFKGIIPMGSKGIAWSFDYQMEQGMGCAGLLADQQGAHQDAFVYPNGPNTLLGGNVWYAHIKVDQADPNKRSFSTFGFLHHAAGVFFSSHNEDVAIGGSAWGNNTADAFLLKVNVVNEQPTEFLYDYIDQYEPFTAEPPITIERKNEPNYVVQVLHARPPNGPSFGVVVNTKPYWVERLDANGPDLIIPSVETHPEAIPVVTALRCPIDNQVDDLSGSDDHNSRLALLGYRSMRARSVNEIRKSFENHDAGWVVQVCAVDKQGRIFAAPAGTIPVRGDVQVLDQDSHWDPLKHFEVYDKIDPPLLVGMPVPAWEPEDEDLEWQRDGLGKVKYLKPIATAPQGEYLGHLFYNPNGLSHPVSSDPYPGLELDPNYENPGFVSASNEYPWHFYKKRYLGDEVAPYDTQNDILDAVLTSWTVHQAWVLTSLLEAAVHSQHFIDHFLEIANPSSTSILPMTEEEAKDFCNNRELYIATDYKIWDESIGDYVVPGTGEEFYRELPVTIRILKELQANLDDVEDEADEDMKFFRDLWNQLHSAQGLWHRKITGLGLQWVNLKGPWVYGTTDPFWYPDLIPGNPGSAEPFDMPTGGQLIDFHWTHTMVGGSGDALPDSSTAEINLATTGDEADFNAAMDALVEWNEFKRTADSTEALLYEENLQGYNGGNYFTARRWVPLFDGVAKAHDSLFFTEPTYPTPSGLVDIPLQGGVFPGDFDEVTGVFEPASPYAGKKLTQFFDPWSDLQGVVFPDFTWASAWKAQGPGKFPIMTFVDLDDSVRSALYDGSGQVKSILSAQDVNTIVTFFLQLGGWYDAAGAAAGTTPSTKKAAFDLWLPKWGKTPHPPTPHRSGYPLTRDMVRVVVLRRLADAQVFTEQLGQTYGDVVRSRAFDYDGVQRWPEDSYPSAGYGFMGAGPAPDHTLLGYPPDYNFVQIEEQRREGFASRFWAKPGSTWPLATFFPENGDVRSFFRISPGNRVMAFDSLHFPGLMLETAEATFADTHFDNYIQHLSSEMATVTHRYAP